MYLLFLIHTNRNDENSGTLLMIFVENKQIVLNMRLFYFHLHTYVNYQNIFRRKKTSFSFIIVFISSEDGPLITEHVLG